MSPEKRSLLLAVIGGMMAAAYLDIEGIVDLSFGFPQGGVVELSYGFPRGGFAEGALMAITGAVAGYAVLLAFRKLRELVTRDEK